MIGQMTGPVRKPDGANFLEVGHVSTELNIEEAI